MYFQLVAFGAEGVGLCRDDVQIAFQAGQILIVGQPCQFLRGVHGLLLHVGFGGQQAQAGQVVFDFLKCGEHGLPVFGNLTFISGQGFGFGCAACAAVKQTQGQRGAQ